MPDSASTAVLLTQVNICLETGHHNLLDKIRSMPVGGFWLARHQFQNEEMKKWT
jgi:hypothetical protein